MSEQKTKTEQNLEAAVALVEALTAQKVAEEAAVVDSTKKMRQLAVALHSGLCTFSHGGECPWHMEREPQSPDGADWTEPAHALWLKRTAASLKVARDIGFIITDPDA